MNTATIRNLVVIALKVAGTDAGDRVYSPRDWATRSEDYPLLLVQTPYEEKQSLGRNAPQFSTVTTVRITARIEKFDSDQDNGAELAELALEDIREQVERAVINSYELTRVIQQFRHIRSTIEVNASGHGHIGQLVFEIDMEYYQGPEDFYPIVSNPLEGIDVRISMPDGTTQPGTNINLQE